jgi:ABC-2 type transport system permease protein
MNCDEYYNVYKSVLEYRINNNIPYTRHENSNVLTSYLETYLTYLELRDNKNLSKEKKDEYREVLKTVKLTQYRMEHNIIDNKENVDLGSATFIASPIDTNTIFLIFGIIVIACGIFSEEFDKGTIKQLLIKPYSRNKIAVAKIITCLIATLIFLIYFIIVNILCGQLLISAFDINSTVLMYDYNLEKVLVYNGFQLIGLYLLYKLPYLILFTLIILLVSVITRNTAISAVSGFMLIILPEILSLLIDKFKPLAYLPFYTWRLDEFMFGGRSTIKQLTFNNSLILDIVYIVIFLISLLIVFKRTDIKNQ